MSLEQRIILTLKWFALQQMGATLLEVHRYLVRDPGELQAYLDQEQELQTVGELDNREVSVGEVLVELDRIMAEGKVGFGHGYYFVTGFADQGFTRWRGYVSGVGREKRVVRYRKLLTYIPFVEGVALAGSQACGVQKPTSDIDLFIFCTKGWLWVPRTIVTGVFQIFMVRRHGSKISGKFCLNHYLSGPKKLIVGKNWYTAMEYGKLRPLVGSYAVSDFQARNMQWLTAFYPNLVSIGPQVEQKSIVRTILEKCLSNSVGRSLETFLERVQRPRIRTEEKYVVVESDELSFHPSSKQESLLRQFADAKEE